MKKGALLLLLLPPPPVLHVMSCRATAFAQRLLPSTAEALIQQNGDVDMSSRQKVDNGVLFKSMRKDATSACKPMRWGWCVSGLIEMTAIWKWHVVTYFDCSSTVIGYRFVQFLKIQKTITEKSSV